VLSRTQPEALFESANPAALPLAALAVEINAEHDLAEASHRESVQHAIRCGELLLRAKQGVPHGKWGEWLTEHVRFAASTARLYMEIAKLDPAKRQRVSDLPLRDALSHQVKAAEDRPPPVAPAQTPSVSPEVAVTLKACVQLAEPDAVLAFVRNLPDPCDIAVTPEKFDRAARSVGRKLRQRAMRRAG
jgi:hypothetical protein